ncbi:MAG: undecaprenyl-diphosphate phosphatase [Endomicrobia bacterium]|nr:undecaprenyl-diphosphate phosphatase [Endomicrobiia bacterium]
MNIQILFLGLVQGITEFLPISSSGHLVLFQNIFGLKEMLFYDVLLHFATILAVIVMFFREIIDYLRKPKIIFYIIILSIPTGIIGLGIKKYFSFVYDNLFLTGLFLGITGLWLFIAEKNYEKQSSNITSVENLGVLRAVLIGIAQGIAVLPGISRSGATIGSMFMLNIEKNESIKFVFIAGIPAVFGATLVELKEALSLGEKFSINYLTGMLAAFITALLALKFLVMIVKKSKIRFFSYYCWFLSFISIFIFLVTNRW